ncbi:MAG: helix-turn-helix domain-containing protein, partial [Planctomycetota bacterium]
SAGGFSAGGFSAGGFAPGANSAGGSSAGGSPDTAVSPLSPRVELFHFASVDVNFQTYEVRVEGHAVQLTSLEMKLLRYFIENEGRVIPRNELLEKVWNMPGHINTRAPDQFIRRLRKLFEPNPAEPRYFLTLRDTGYRFVASGKP